MKVAVLKGGRSLERAGLAALAERGSRTRSASLGHEVVAIDAGADLVRRLSEERPDVAFVALHGPDGEDGTVQELLEILGIPYTGPGVAACMRCMDKVAAKHGCAPPGSRRPDWVAFNADRLPRARRRRHARGDRGPARLPARRQAGGAGLVARRPLRRRARRRPGGARRRVQLRRPRPARAPRRGARARGRRCSTASRCRSSRRSRREEDRYNYEARYEIGRTEFTCPAELAEDEAQQPSSDAARRTWEALGLRRLRPRRPDARRRAGPQVLEVNAIPGLTDTSLLPMAAEAAGSRSRTSSARILELAPTPTRRSRRRLGDVMVAQPPVVAAPSRMLTIVLIQLGSAECDDELQRACRGVSADRKSPGGGLGRDRRLLIPHLEWRKGLSDMTPTARAPLGVERKSTRWFATPVVTTSPTRR